MCDWFARLVAVVIVAGGCVAALADGDAPAADTPVVEPEKPDVPPKSDPDPAGPKVMPVDQYRQLMEQLGSVADPAEGVPLLEAFIQAHSNTPQAEQAQRELALWKERVEKGQLRFGKMWLPREEVDKKNAKVEELLAAAAAAEGVDAAVKLLNQAAQVHPHRSDIHFAKFQALLKANREKEAVGALGPIRMIEPNNVAMLNNMGVLCARQKQWAQAFDLLLKAIDRNPDIDAVWDNLDQAIASAEEAGLPANSLTAIDNQIRAQVAKLHKAGKQVGQTRWGNSWISETDYANYVKENRQSAQKTATLKANVRKLQGAKNNLEAERKPLAAKKTKTDADNERIKQIDKRMDEVQKQLDKAEDALHNAKGVEPGHADKFVLLNLQGSELQTMDPKADDGKDKKDKGGGGGLFD